jgi:D-alanyl-lipoteichoic acid acyltransferase DltB (MBOAT superfamily)
VIIIIAYFIIPLKHRWLVLLAGSVVFYVFQGVKMLPYIVLAAFVGWLGGFLIERSEDRKRAKLFCSISVIMLVAVLAFIKLVRYMPSTVAGKIIVPIGISYYTFSLISYVVDIYWKKQVAEHNFFKVLLFAIYFPKILQGPISRYNTLGKQLVEGHRFDYQQFCFGLQLMLWGLFKKLVIADRLSIFTGSVFADPLSVSGSIVVVTAIFAAFELYCDFSGCMDIARGISQIFGIELEKNFNHPFFSRSAAEFWRRWHITLGTWFKDYIYMPIVTSKWMAKLLQKSKKKFGTRFGKNMMAIVPLTVVWLLTGIWHGTGLSYVIWGIYWGAMIIISQVCAPEIKKLVKLLHINTTTESYRIFQMVRTFLLFCIGRIITIPGSLRTSAKIFYNIIFNFKAYNLIDQSLYGFGLNAANFTLVIFLLIFLWCVSMLQERGGLRERIAGYNIVIRWLIIYAGIVAIFVFGIYGPGYEASSFMYMGY